MRKHKRCTIEELATLLGIHRHTCAKLIKQERIDLTDLASIIAFVVIMRERLRQ